MGSGGAALLASLLLPRLLATWAAAAVVEVAVAAMKAGRGGVCHWPRWAWRFAEDEVVVVIPASASASGGGGGGLPRSASAKLVVTSAAAVAVMVRSVRK